MPTILSSTPSRNSEYLRTYRFELIYPDVAGKWFSLNLISAEIPPLAFDTQSLWDGTVNTNYINKLKYASFRLDFYMNIVSDPIYAWIQQHVTMADMRCPMDIKLTQKANGMPTYKKNMVLKLYDGKQRTAVDFTLLGCLLTNIQFSGLDYSQSSVMRITLTVLPDRVIYPQGTNLYPDMLNTVPGVEFVNRVQTNVSDMITGALGLPPGLMNNLMNVQGMVGGAFQMSSDTLNLLGLGGAADAYNTAMGKANDFMNQVGNQGKACQGDGSDSIIDSLAGAASNMLQQLKG